MALGVRRSIRLILAASLICGSLFSPCWAQSSAEESGAHGWDFVFWVAGATGEEHTNSFAEGQILTIGFGAGKVISSEIGHGWRRGRIEYAFGVTPLFVQIRPGNIYGVGFEPIVLRWNSSVHTSSRTPYIELAGGGLLTNTNFPTGNTSNFNFTARVGAGIQILERPHGAMDIGCRWFHVSNANLGMRNPEFNGVQVVVGYHWHR